MYRSIHIHRRCTSFSLAYSCWLTEIIISWAAVEGLANTKDGEVLSLGHPDSLMARH